MNDGCAIDIAGPTAMRHADVNGIRLAYRVLGASGPPLVLIMGYRLSSRAWPLDFVARLAERFTVVLLDNRGTGESDKPTAGYEISNMATDVRGLLDHLNIPRAHVLGYSMGGAIAQEFVRQFPDRVSSLVLCATMCGGARATYASSSTIRIMREHEGLTPQEIARRIWTITYSPRYLARHRELAENQMQREIAAPTPSHAADLQFQAFAEFDGARALPDFRVPTLVLTGDSDLLVSPENSKLIASLIPGAELVVIPDCGHRLMWEATSECVDLVADFLAPVSRDDRRSLPAPGQRPDPLADFAGIFAPAISMLTSWPWMLASASVQAMTVARQSAYFGGKAQYGDGKPVVLVPQPGSDLQFQMLSNWLKMIGYRPAIARDGAQAADLVRAITERAGRKAVLVAPGSLTRTVSAIAGAHPELISDIVLLNASDREDIPVGARAHFIAAGFSLSLAMAALPQVLRNIQIELIGMPAATGMRPQE